MKGRGKPEEKHLLIYIPTEISLTYLGHLELGDHVLLRVIRDTLVGEQSAGQVLLVVPLKHILFLHEAEQHHGLVQYRLHLLFCQLAEQTNNINNNGTACITSKQSVCQAGISVA